MIMEFKDLEGLRLTKNRDLVSKRINDILTDELPKLVDMFLQSDDKDYTITSITLEPGCEYIKVVFVPFGFSSEYVWYFRYDNCK